MTAYHKMLCFVLVAFLWGCNPEEDMPIPTPEQRTFKMGFTSWSHGPNWEDVNETYSFLATQADSYTEHLDSPVPWKAWMENGPLPTAFTDEIAGRVARKITTSKLVLSVGLLNSDRSDIALDYDGTSPGYERLDDPALAQAYFEHLKYLIDRFRPQYLIMAIEVNELKLRAPEKWEAYKVLATVVKANLKALYPSLKVSESISLHNLYNAQGTEGTEAAQEMIAYMNQMDFAALSYYPFLQNQHATNEFQPTFDFLHSTITVPIAFVETGQIAEDLIVPSLGLSMEGNEETQNGYLETLLQHAQEQDYEFVTWWAHRDFDALWETFPSEVKDIGQLWRDTGLLDETRKERPSYETWRRWYEPK